MSDDNGEKVNPKSHRGLLRAISSLGKVQHIRKTTRDEPKTQKDEFQLVKQSSRTIKQKYPVGINEVVKLLKSSKKHLKAGKSLNHVLTKKKVLPKPIEKPAADRLKRTIGYENLKKKFGRWDAVVSKNRTAETKVFPLPLETVYVDTSAHAKPLQLAMKSDLMLQMQAAEEKLKALQQESRGEMQHDDSIAKLQKNEILEKLLTRQELIERRKEFAHLKMRESQKSARARMRNKIKSKKYHKLLKRQKINEEMKEFELLKKTDPEAALDKLKELEKRRVLERATLRHKNTGSWAKNLQIRAKYDKDVRKDLAEQIQISRELTQHRNSVEKDEDGEENDTIETEKSRLVGSINDPSNPWTNYVSDKMTRVKGTAETVEVASWRKYWLERNKNEKLLEEHKKEEKEEVSFNEDNDGEPPVEPKRVKKKKTERKFAIKENNLKASKKLKNKVKSSEKINICKLANKIKVSKKVPKGFVENGWIVENLKTASIDSIFDEQEEQIKVRLTQKLNERSKLKKGVGNDTKQTNLKRKLAKSEEDGLKQLKDLSFKEDIKKPFIDEELNAESAEAQEQNELNRTFSTASGDEANKTATNKDINGKLEVIDPTKLAAVKVRQSSYGLSVLDAEMNQDEDPDIQSDPHITISQAFEDDDIVADFSREKTKNAELKNTEIRLSMPGWGYWAGPGISENEAESKRPKPLVLKLAEQEHRRDENKNSLFINEEANKHLRTHLVSDLPFPFKTLADYEASIRAPIGRSFVPETAFRMLTRPAIITKKGQIIDPMDENELVKPPRKLRHALDKRIAHVSKNEIKI